VSDAVVWPDDVEPGTLRQPDQVSCGAATVVAARMILDPAYRPPDPQQEIRRAHRALTSLSDPTGGAQLPWPRMFGTPPWAVANALEAQTGEPVHPHVARLSPEASYGVLAERTAARPTGVYVGNGWLPRHVVLAVGVSARGIRVFDPAGGRLLTVSERRWAGHRVDVARWTHFWAVV
jgi:hypothetical protein